MTDAYESIWPLLAGGDETVRSLIALRKCIGPPLGEARHAVTQDRITANGPELPQILISLIIAVATTVVATRDIAISLNGVVLSVGITIAIDLGVCELPV